MNRKKDCSRRKSMIWLFAVVITISMLPCLAASAAKAPKKITLNHKSVSIVAGKKVRLKVKSVRPSGASRKVRWKSSNKKIATVNSKGRVKGKKAGSVRITAYSRLNPKVKAVCKVKVYAKTKNLQLNSKASYSIAVGDSVALKATVTNPKKNYQPITWTSSKAALAKITEQGVVTAVAPGEAVMTASSGGKKVSVTIKVSEKNAADDNVGGKKYTVSFDLGYAAGTDAPASQTVNAGETAKRPEDPERGEYQFAGWFLDKNESDLTNTYNFGTPVQSDLTLYAIWVDVTKDTDGDGLSDQLERYVRTKVNLADTDGDGLNDYQEVAVLGTNPLLIDTNGNGITDFDEDADEDGLTNGTELGEGTNPNEADTDADGLGDYEEIYSYKTSPSEADTDGDGADDGWELNNGFDPLSYNSTFLVEVDTESVTEDNPVSASVSTDVKGGQIESLNITPVSVTDNPYISESIPGYLGKAYDFQIDGGITSAELSFSYDTSLGRIGDDFQPRIYYFNESTKELVELPNQTVRNGIVTASVSHFSTYLLLNKTVFDKVWEEEIKPPLSSDDGEQVSLDIAFAIDYSESMCDNDPKQIFKRLTKEFIAKLRDDVDRAAIVKFIASASTVASLTSDKDILNQAVDSIEYDNGYGSNSGTNGSDGYKRALDELADSDADYKYIIFITDGEDNRTSYDYDELISESVLSGVVVYTIGIGSVSEDILRKIGQETGGQYYHVTTNSTSEDISELNDVFMEIAENTVDLNTDTNEDGISDYYTEMIKEGKLLLSNGSNEFEGFDFNYDANGDPSDDYDGDGLKNGEEITVVERDGRVYLSMYSNPVLVYSDMDDYDDYTESCWGTNPLKYQTSKSLVDSLCNDDGYGYSSAVQSYENDWLWKADTGFLAAIYGVWNKDELYRDIMIDYFANYCKADYVEKLQASEIKISMVESLSSLVSKVKKYATSPYSEIEKILKLISKINGTSDQKTIRYLLLTYEKTVSEIAVLDPELSMVSISTYSMKSTTLINLTAINGKIGKFCKGVTYAGYVADIADTITEFSKVSANSRAFENNLDILKEIQAHANDDNARNAASAIIDKLSESFAQEVVAIGGDLGEIVGKQLISKLSKVNIYALAVVVVRDGIDIITGISSDLKQHFQMITYAKMDDATVSLIKGIVAGKGSSYYVEEDDINDLDRYLVNLAQIRILGEKKYCEWQKDEGIIGWFSDNKDVESWVNAQVKSIKGIVSSLGLTISTLL